MAPKQKRVSIAVEDDEEVNKRRAPPPKAKIRKQVIVPAKDPQTGVITIQPIGGESILKNKEVLTATLKMLEARGDHYDVKNLISSLEEIEDALQFQVAILHPEYLNPLRDLLASSTFYSKRAPPPFRVMMSLLVKNSVSSDTYTAVFFADRKTMQVSKRLLEEFFDALANLKASALKVSEVIIITPGALSHDSEGHLKSMSSGCFSQVFRDEEVLAPAIECSYAPKIKIYTQEETRAFFKREPNYHPTKMEQRPNTDAQLKYLGAKPNRVIEILRTTGSSMSMRQTELLYAWVFEAR